MDVFGIIWFVFVLAMCIVPPILEGRKKRAKRAAQDAARKVVQMKKSASAREVEQAQAAARRKAELARKVEAQKKAQRPVPKFPQMQPVPAGTSSSSHAVPQVKYEPTPDPTPQIAKKGKRLEVIDTDGPHKKIVSSAKDLIVYSAIMKPKFDDA